MRAFLLFPLCALLLLLSPSYAAEVESGAVSEEKQGLAPPSSSTLLEQAKADADNKHAFAIILSSTEGIHMSAYERFGSLWILINAVDVPIAPYIEGGRSDQPLPELKKHIVAEGTATLWQLPLSEDFKISGEGGSLYWRIILSHGDGTGSKKAVQPQVRDVKSNTSRSGDILLPKMSDPKIIRFQDPVAGDDLVAVLVDTSESATQNAYQFVDFDILPTFIGAVLQLKNIDVDVKVIEEGVSISATDGLALTNPGDISKQTQPPQPSPDQGQNTQTLFNFQEWSMGPKSALAENERLLLASLQGKSDAGKAERLMALAKLKISHGFGIEAKGFLENATTLMPQLERSPSFMALRGVASNIAYQHDLAIQDLAHPSLEDYAEVNLWKSATLAHLGDWQQAIASLPNDLGILLTYPDDIAIPLILTLTEIALRDGRKEVAKELLAKLEEKKETLSTSHQNGIKYLKGEILRQNDEEEEAIVIWTKLSKEEDPLYQTKSELALVSLGRQDETLDAQEAVNRLENLRFVWRGDDLEIQVLRRLGLSEIESKRYVDGFKTLRDTVVLSENDALSADVTSTMMQTYEDIFLTDRIETITPIDAAMLYEEFRELTPGGEKGDRLIARLAERLVDADFFQRAIDLLAYQLDFRLQGEEAIITALRMAAIQLMDRKPDAALSTLNKADALLLRSDFPNKALRKRDLDLLRARALSEVDDVDGALNLLEGMDPPSSDISRLEADIAWRAARWDEAADALRELVLDKEYSSDEELSEEDASLLLNYVISLNLSDQRITLRNIRERHLDQMQMTDYGERFEVITRPRQDVMLADRETMQKMIGETEIFSDFLNTYK